MSIGVRKDDPSSAGLKIMAPRWEQLRQILQSVAELGAAMDPEDDAVLAPAPRDGVYPQGFYATTNLETWVRVDGEWLRLENEEMDCGIVVDKATGKARSGPFCLCRHQSRCGHQAGGPGELSIHRRGYRCGIIYAGTDPPTHPSVLKNHRAPLGGGC